ncbi:hypothetical protein LIER_34705 [Lithospermum erythrorhizon]|uniref:Uncharacterized protein n=1 Tax=Lithospermum erythrorhizon TaxID=34254 RepID=A0AAV3S1N0_LITER
MPISCYNNKSGPSGIEYVERK